MASTLYQKLQNPEVIPLEHTSIRNIINRFAEQNDGYQVLYAMLELVHPALHQDAVVLPPNSLDCNEDVHLYAQKFDSWLRYEAYANRPYSSRETVNHFIRGLSQHFAPAVNRIRRLMDTWNPYDTNVPEPLRITTLPNMVDRFMIEECGNALHIRRIQNPKQDHRDKDMKDKTRESDTRQTVDIYWQFCGAHGHPSTNCDFMDKWITAHESLKKVDAKGRENLQAKFKQEQQRRRTRKLKKRLHTVRKIVDNGGAQEEVLALLDSIPDLIDPSESDSVNERSTAPTVKSDTNNS
jgi:hypothetical protein